jgi:hypothetical protein
MVFTAAPDEVLYPARDRLVAAFDRWAWRQRRSASPFVIEALVEHRWETGDGILCRWQPADLVLTQLGVGLVTGRLRRQGVTVPTLEGLLDETAEVVIAHAFDAPTAAQGDLLTRWCDRYPHTASADLRALAARTDDRSHTASLPRPTPARPTRLPAGTFRHSGRKRQSAN